MNFSTAVVLILILQVSVAWGADSEKCQRWDWAAGNSTVNEPGLQMNCQRNSSCTGIQCYGTYTYKVITFTRSVDFCFGYRLNPCSNPVTVDIYLQVPKRGVSKVIRTENSDNFQIPGLTYKIVGDSVKADVFLEVAMGVPQKGYVDFGVDVTVRVDYIFQQSWPDSLKHSLVPRRNLFLRSCKSHVSQAPVLFPPACSKSFPVTTAAPVTTPTPKPPTGKACDPIALYSCPSNKICRNRVCVCLDEYLDGSGGCIAYSTDSPRPTPIPVPSADSSKTPSNKHTTVIVSSVIAGIVGIILVAVVILIVVRWRRARARYANHELLLSNDDNMVM